MYNQKTNKKKKKKNKKYTHTWHSTDQILKIILEITEVKIH